MFPRHFRHLGGEHDIQGLQARISVCATTLLYAVYLAKISTKRGDLHAAIKQLLSQGLMAIVPEEERFQSPYLNLFTILKARLAFAPYLIQKFSIDPITNLIWNSDQSLPLTWEIFWPLWTSRLLTCLSPSSGTPTLPALCCGHTTFQFVAFSFDPSAAP